MEVKDGEVTCPECNGNGSLPHHPFNYFCSKCKGTGKLDWIEMVVGKKHYMIKPGVYVSEVDVSEIIIPTEPVKVEVV